MKKLIATLLTALLLLSCLAALAEAVDPPFFAPEIGMTLDLGPIQRKAENTVFAQSNGILRRDPTVGMVVLYYYDLPMEPLLAALEAFDTAIEAGKDPGEAAVMSGHIGYVVASDAADREAMLAALNWAPSETVRITEFGTTDRWHYYYIALPVEALEPFANAPMSEEQARARLEKDAADVGMIHEEMLAQLRSAERDAPTDPEGAMIGQTIRFESTDLDGNAVRSEDLFRENRITMVNLWGTWCGNCLNEMAELAAIHTRLREKGCGVIGVEFEQKPIEAIEGQIRAVLADNGVEYPNVLFPADNPIFTAVQYYPTTFFVDSEGMILTYPIQGAMVSEYEPTVEKLLAAMEADAPVEADAAASGGDGYRVRVCDPEGRPVEGAVIQFCDDAICTFQTTDADGVAAFDVDEEKVYEVHVLQTPEGFRPDGETYLTPEAFSEVNITLERAE